MLRVAALDAVLPLAIVMLVVSLSPLSVCLFEPGPLGMGVVGPACTVGVVPLRVVHGALVGVFLLIVLLPVVVPGVGCIGPYHPADGFLPRLLYTLDPAH